MLYLYIFVLYMNLSIIALFTTPKHVFYGILSHVFLQLASLVLNYIFILSAEVFLALPQRCTQLTSIASTISTQ